MENLFIAVAALVAGGAASARLPPPAGITALRDIQDLVARGILARNSGGGRSTSYSLADIP